MILVFGGTTEGRRAVEVLEEAGSPYYYSTRSHGQQIELLHGSRLEGDLDVAKAVTVCRQHGIRLIIDAAHPFAERLHCNLLYVARHIGAPIIRYDRIYPPRCPEFTWCHDYQDAMAKLEAQGINRLLVLTGVNNIATLRPYWAKAGNECWCRILNRQFSLLLARNSQFPEDHLVFFQEDNTPSLLQELKPQAILTKESGISGGFSQKVAAARRAGVRVFVIERPHYPPHTPISQQVTIARVNGPHGLRRAVERLLPEFFPLHSGLTTGTCATAAAIAAMRMFLRGERAALKVEGNDLPTEVPVVLPDGETISVAVGYGRGYAYCTKEAGDDPDVTNGLQIRATVSLQCDAPDVRVNPCPSEAKIEIRGGEGIGRFTLPGFDYPPGEAAINRSPRQMIRQNLEKLIMPADRGVTWVCTISAPGGADVARRTFNPRLGIEGGISIIGVSGIVKPFSEEAFIDSIRKCMQVAKASGTSRIVLNSGAKSERYLRERYPCLPQQAFVQYGNFIGETLRMAADLDIPQVTLGVMLGKAVKLAEGQMDTHSRKGTMNLEFINSMLVEAQCPTDVSGITLARELWDKLSAEQASAFATVVIAHCMKHCQELLSGGRLTIILITEDGRMMEGG